MATQVTVTMPNVNGLTRDNVVNTFAVVGLDSGSTALQITNVLAAINVFYNTAPAGGTRAMAAYIGDGVSRAANAVVARFYDLAGHLNGSAHGSPFATGTITLVGAADPTQLPSEVAFAITFEATGRAAAAVEQPDGVDAGTAIDRPKQRKTGRIYLGPLNLAAMDGTGTQCRPTAAIMLDARLATKVLNSNIAAVAAGFGLGVWSRQNALLLGLEAVSTDDAFDTQRRRGVDPTARTRLAIP